MAQHHVSNNAFLDAMFEIAKRGDPKCKHQPGDRIMKVATDADGDMNVVGTAGTVLGGLYIEKGLTDPDWGLCHEFYFIQYDDFEYPVGTIGQKIQKL